jgi:MscS family membrane protein
MGHVPTTTITRVRIATALIVCASVALVLAARARAQEGPAIALDRLRPVDTSSPRDTLRNFLDHFDASVAAWRAGDESARRRAASLASASLDFSEDPSRGSYIRRFEKMVMLKEVLDRIELPPYEQIPGKEQVEDKGVLRWTVPGTLIDFVKIEERARQGLAVQTDGAGWSLRRASCKSRASDPQAMDRWTPGVDQEPRV